MPTAAQPNVIHFGWNMNWETSSPGNITPFFAPFYQQCSGVCFPRIHADWISHVPKLKSWPQNPTGWSENLPPCTTSGDIEFLNMAIYPFELLSGSLSPQCVPGRNRCSSMIPGHFPNLRRRRARVMEGACAGQASPNISNACSIDFPLWFMEIALYLNHIIQLGRILISTLPFCPHV